VINLSLGAIGSISQFALQQDAIKQHVCDKDGIIDEGREGWLVFFLLEAEAVALRCRLHS
jgi:hypothetical protein